MISKKRKRIYDKFGGKCAYTGKPLGDDWQVDHMTSKIKHEYSTYYKCADLSEIRYELKKVDDEKNLVPACRIINHYKRGLDLEGFRHYMSYFHERLSRLPKNTKIERTKKRKEYLQKVADLFEITPDKPFKGTFYFETVGSHCI